MSLRTYAPGLLILGAAMLAACGGSSYGSNPNPNPNPSCTTSATRICVKNTAFNKSVDTVSSGLTVVWQNEDGFGHTTTSSTVPGGATAWDKSLAAGAKDSVTFTVTGTYAYYCKIHGSPGAGMRGTIVVQ
jgi:plastocyanin